MRILQLCKKFPYPLKDGEAIAVTYLSKAMRDLGCEITLLSMNTTKHYTDVGQLPSDFDHYKEIHWTDLDNAIKPVDAFINLFSDSSYHITRFVSQAYRNKLIEILQRNTYDIVQLETLYLAPYVEVIKQYSDARVVMRAHNVEHEIWDRISSNTNFFLKKWYLMHLARKLKTYEVNNLNNYDFLVALTDRDLKKFKRMGYKNGAMASPIGIETDKYLDHNYGNGKAFSLCFIGSLDWMPNIEGLNWFLDQVWPKVVKACPDVKLHVAGRNTPKNLLNLRMKNVVVHGEVPDAARFIGEHTAMVVPLFSGSGMRVKILEGMALGRIVITTDLGKEGIEAEHKHELLVANDADAFVEAIRFAKENKYLMQEMSDSARDFVITRFDNQEIAQKLYGIYERLTSEEYASHP